MPVISATRSLSRPGLRQSGSRDQDRTPSLVLLEHYLAPEFGDGMETLDVVRIGADGSPHWSRVWPTPEDNPGTPGWSCGWPPTGTRSSAGPQAGSTHVRARATPAVNGLPTGLGVVREAQADETAATSCGVARCRAVVPQVCRLGGRATICRRGHGRWRRHRTCPGRTQQGLQHRC